mgnify:CR=1 FL=1
MIVTGWMKDLGAEVVEVQKWGKRRLAYEVRKRRDGVYTMVVWNGAQSMVKELERDVQVADHHGLEFANFDHALRQCARMSAIQGQAREPDDHDRRQRCGRPVVAIEGCHGSLLSLSVSMRHRRFLM